jgi:hypothetical protein
MRAIEVNSMLLEFPEQRDALMKILDLIDERFNGSIDAKEITAQEIFSIAHPTPQSILIEMMF